MFAGLPNPLSGMRYHSLVVVPETLSDDFEVTAWVDGHPEVIMGIRHRRWPVEGIQFHPESFMTPLGRDLIARFLEGDPPS